MSSLSISQDVHVSLHLARVIVKLLDLNISEPLVNVLVTDLDTGLMNGGDVVQLDRAAEIVVLDSESLNREDIIRQRILEAFTRLADETLFDYNDLGLPIFIIGDSLLIERDLGLLLNIEFVGAVRLVALTRPIEVTRSVLIQGKCLHNLVTCCNLFPIHLRNLIMLWTEKLANCKESCLGDLVVVKVEWILFRAEVIVIQIVQVPESNSLLPQNGEATCNLSGNKVRLLFFRFFLFLFRACTVDVELFREAGYELVKLILDNLELCIHFGLLIATSSSRIACSSHKIIRAD